MPLDPSKISIGTVVEWMGVPVVVVDQPRLVMDGSTYPKGKWEAKAMYLYAPTGYASDVVAGRVRNRFILNNKELWPHPLTDEEEAMAMRGILLGE